MFFKTRYDKNNNNHSSSALSAVDSRLSGQRVKCAVKNYKTTPSEAVLLKLEYLERDMNQIIIL